jgi:hypothetical protein
MPTVTGMFSPEDIFEAFLFEQVQRKKAQEGMNTTKTHRAFYLAKKEFSDLMDEYDFLLGTEPYSPTLDQMFQTYRRSGILTVDGKVKNSEPLKEPSEELKPVAGYICDKV